MTPEEEGRPLRVRVPAPDVEPPALYHWTPTERLEAIRRDGLVPGSARCVTSTEVDTVCFGYSPAGAWRLSGAMSWAPQGRWELLQWRVPDSAAWYDRGDGEEARTRERVPWTQLWWVGSRTVGARP